MSSSSCRPAKVLSNASLNRSLIAYAMHHLRHQKLQQLTLLTPGDSVKRSNSCWTTNQSFKHGFSRLEWGPKRQAVSHVFVFCGNIRMVAENRVPFVSGENVCVSLPPTQVPYHWQLSGQYNCCNIRLETCRLNSERYHLFTLPSDPFKGNYKWLWCLGQLGSFRWVLEE